MELKVRLEALIESVRDEHAPDPRLAVFEVEVEEDGEGLRLVGVTSEPAAAEELHRRVALLETPLPVDDAVRRLPLLRDEGLGHALVVSASAPMLAGPIVSEPTVSQVVLGHRLLVLREHGRWLNCRSEDGYLGWIHRGYLRRFSESDAREWEIGAEGEACFSLGARVTDAHGEVIAYLPWGSRFVHRDGAGVLPTGIEGRVEGEWVALAERSIHFPPVGEAVTMTATRWIGAPYLWGGITPAGVDCSGLSQAAYRTHGLVLPRDSDMQARAGREVDPGADFSRLRAGDLLFFAEEPGRVTHVAISLGGSRIIHSSLGNGGVARNDLNGELNYEKELRGLFVCARRFLPESRVATA